MVVLCAASGATGLPNYEIDTIVDSFPFILLAIFTLLVVVCPGAGYASSSTVNVDNLWVKLAMGAIYLAISIAFLVGYVVPGFDNFDRVGWETLALCVVLKITSLLLGHGWRGGMCIVCVVLRGIVWYCV